MKKKLKDSILESEEKQNMRWFLTLFFIILFCYDFICYYLIPKYNIYQSVEFPNMMGYWLYIIMLINIPIFFYLRKRNKQSYEKYIFFSLYIILALINEIVSYRHSPLEYQSGNVVEVFVVLFAPMFVNFRFFYFVYGSVIGKYTIIGAVLQTTIVIVPAILITLISIVSYILLHRFQAYVQAVTYSYDKQLETLAKGVIATLELKDPYTRGHSERVANYAIMLAEEMGQFHNEELKMFYNACLLHDIGKIHIPDFILTKPGRLTAEEFEIIKSHPVVGEEAIKNVTGLQNGLPVIRSHHERWDGTGYPDQLSKTDIPILARITAIADAFDAMTSSRSYRAALSLEEAHQRIIEGCGTQFDPDLVVIFQKVYPRWVQFHQGCPHHKDNSKEVI
ncbi:HD-GYP domain-containing protein [Bacillus manliponensis]|uniref:HD-GYP domain-containing protein n=1 Tax=Bacillus manliponensis TaxID=574376 RepID=UPI003513109E